MEGYLTEFENICDKLAEMGNPLNDEVKKSILLKNIEDPWYEPWIATCNRLDYDETLNELRAAALRNGKYSKSHSRYERRNANLKNTTEEQQRTGPYYPIEVWSKMSPECRKMIIEYREKMKKGDQPDILITKKHYDKDNPEDNKKNTDSTSDMHKQNLKKTEDEKEQKQGKEEEHPYASLFKKSVISPKYAKA